ncbi:MAG: ABC transporter ATP-binding protein [Brachybacterium sp.]|uniref:ABC transporter ATP-binding protein n=1 Tax=Brachybacterium sp. TaxID=1891286 RepID=UPI00264726E6|nr:ABC transporter ATP-binding protein [Brachybacterium sp.]MDN5685132.1 ABC transporter ATP-binding protein [Brachybacterium sp.]
MNTAQSSTNPSASTPSSPDRERLLRVEELSVIYEPVGAEPTNAVRDVSFEAGRGEFIGLVGESGSGKSTLGYALTGLTSTPARLKNGRVVFDGVDIAGMSQEALRRQRQGGFAMVMQAGMNSLNPVRSVRKHFHDIFRAHGHLDRRQWDRQATDLLEKVELSPDVLDSFPGELSGGMRQRATIALALSLEPRLMVFDEPTTALDVLVQQAVMDTIRGLQAEEEFTAILISHDLGMVLESAHRVLVMHQGRIVEDAPSAQILADPQHEYTRMLLSHYADPRAETVSLPGLEDVARSSPPRENSTAGSAPSSGQAVPDDPDPSAGTELRVEHVSKVFAPARRRARPVRAVDDVSFTLPAGGATALVGQSGSGKSTIAKLITGVERPTQGRITLGDVDVGSVRKRELRDLRRTVQMVFQDPYAALNPLNTVEYVLTRALRNLTTLRGDALRARLFELLEIVGLTPVEQFAAKLPHQLSGGQRQRVVIARALACEPQVIIADEPVSMLDQSLRAGVLALLRDLRVRTGVSLLYITHDLLSARVITDDILVLHHGRVVEHGPTSQIMRDPQDEYTTELLDAIPNPARTHGV